MLLCVVYEAILTNTAWTDNNMHANHGKNLLLQVVGKFTSSDSFYDGRQEH